MEVDLFASLFVLILVLLPFVLICVLLVCIIRFVKAKTRYYDSLYFEQQNKEDFRNAEK